MGHKCFISFKTEDFDYKDKISKMNIDMIDKSLDKEIDSEDEDYIMRKIREDYLADSTVTIHLIGEYSAEKKGWKEQKYIKRELQASLYNGKGNTRSGILGIVLPSMVNAVYLRKEICSECGKEHSILKVDDDTTIKEFSYNYFIPPKPGCCWNDDDRYCILVKWSDFKDSPEKYIDQAYDKRFAPVSNKIKVRP